MTEKILNKTVQTWNELNGYWTAKEISQQPATWKKTIQQVKKETYALKSFISKVISQDDFDIILTGAGTSEFVGNSIYSYLNTKADHKVKSYGTTDLVACPENYLSRKKPTLLISFARSGNSPESVGAVEAANTVCEHIYHLFVTCNKDGALSKYAEGKENCYALNLTPETHDQSFAMTSSYSNMYLATLLAFHTDDFVEFASAVEVMIESTQKFLDAGFDKLCEIVNEYDFQRIVYLGSNSLKGVAQESALKMCELTGGNIDTVFDTPLGFRHGPKSVINDQTLTVIYLSDDAFARRYEMDLVKEMSVQRKCNKILAVSSYEDDDVKELVDYFVSFSNGINANNVLLGLEYITVAQILGLFKSLKCGFGPDNPCPTGEVNRVVKGVTIYPYIKK